VIISWNEAAQRIFGYTPEEAIGRSILLLIPTERQDEEPRLLARIRRGERVEHFEAIRRCKDGRLLDISLTISPIKDGHGRIVGASKIARVITDRKKAEQALREAHEELARTNAELEQRVLQRTASLHEAIAQMEEFSYTVSHDLRAPLRGMHTFSQVCSRTMPPPSTRRPDIASPASSKTPPDSIGWCSMSSRSAG
jgi:PAS domain S-box-containing protein